MHVWCALPCETNRELIPHTHPDMVNKCSHSLCVFLSSGALVYSLPLSSILCYMKCSTSLYWYLEAVATSFNCITLYNIAPSAFLPAKSPFLLLLCARCSSVCTCVCVSVCMWHLKLHTKLVGITWVKSQHSDKWPQHFRQQFLYLTKTFTVETAYNCSLFYSSMWNAQHTTDILEAVAMSLYHITLDNIAPSAFTRTNYCISCNITLCIVTIFSIYMQYKH